LAASGEASAGGPAGSALVPQIAELLPQNLFPRALAKAAGALAIRNRINYVDLSIRW